VGGQGRGGGGWLCVCVRALSQQDGKQGRAQLEGDSYQMVPASAGIDSIMRTEDEVVVGQAEEYDSRPGRQLLRRAGQSLEQQLLLFLVKIYGWSLWKGLGVYGGVPSPEGRDPDQHQQRRRGWGGHSLHQLLLLLLLLLLLRGAGLCLQQLPSWPVCLIFAPILRPKVKDFTICGLASNIDIQLESVDGVSIQHLPQFARSENAPGASGSNPDQVCVRLLLWCVWERSAQSGWAFAGAQLKAQSTRR